MCIAVVTKPGKNLNNAQLWAGWGINRDGGGFAYVKDNKVVIKKGYRVYNEFQKAYREAVEEVGNDSPFLIHMRISTSGLVSGENTHPFPVGHTSDEADSFTGAMIHNGILFSPFGELAGQPADRKSDTRIVSEQLTKLLVLENVLKAKDMMGKAINGGNKLCFLYEDKTFVIVNESSGRWKDDIWYSNNSCDVPVTRPSTPSAASATPSAK